MGWEATRALRADPQTKNIPILASTALFRRSDLKTWIDVDADDYIIKPFTSDELLEKLQL